MWSQTIVNVNQLWETKFRQLRYSLTLEMSAGDKISGDEISGTKIPHSFKHQVSSKLRYRRLRLIGSLWSKGGLTRLSG